MDFETEFSKYYLMMTILVKRRVDPELIEKRREDRYRTQIFLECESVH